MHSRFAPQSTSIAFPVEVGIIGARAALRIPLFSLGKGRAGEHRAGTPCGNERVRLPVREKFHPHNKEESRLVRITVEDRPPSRRRPVHGRFYPGRDLRVSLVPEDFQYLFPADQADIDAEFSAAISAPRTTAPGALSRPWRQR